MPSKAQIPPALDLSNAKSSNKNGLQPGLLSPSTLSPRSARSLRSPGSTPASPLLQNLYPPAGPNNVTSQTVTMTATHGPQSNGPTSPRITAMPEFPPSPSRPSPKHGRDPSKSFFSNLMASKSSHKLDSPTPNNEKEAGRLTVKSRASSKDRSLHALRGKSSTPNLPKMPQNERQYDATPTQPTVPENLSDGGSQAPSKKAKSRLGGILHRTKSIKMDDGDRMNLRDRRPSQLNLEAMPVQPMHAESQYAESVKTAPLRSDHREKAFADNNGSFNRNRSADRRPATNESATRGDRSGPPIPSSHSFRDGATLQILSKVHQTGMGVGDRLGKAGKGFFGKITRSDSSNARELVPDEVYTCTVINLPLIKQTRTTRIARRLELSKDKTEFWMPSLPWRCIDYLNMNGCEEEGLYRIPGSGRDVKHWQRRFDTEYDINLFDEPELYDINTIGSMFKSWLRELPDEILPRKTQIMIAQRCQGATTTPQLLKDELSKLPPFHYYLLFAITCHLSLLHSFADKNKMDYRNLCICFQPCLKIDGFCFQFLVQDWKNCWQGCWTEKEYLDEEYRYEKEGSISEQNTGSEEHSADERAISSSGSSLHTRQRSTTRSTHRANSSTGTQGHDKTTSRDRGNGYGAIPPLPSSNGLHPYVHVHQSSEPQSNENARLPEVQAISPINISPLANAG